MTYSTLTANGEDEPDESIFPLSFVDHPIVTDRLTLLLEARASNKKRGEQEVPKEIKSSCRSENVKLFRVFVKATSTGVFVFMNHMEQSIGLSG